MTEPSKKLEIELKKIPDDYIILVETKPEKSLEITMSLVKLLSNQSEKCIIISANRPYTNLVNHYIRNEIDIKKIFIIDCISHNLNKVENKNNVIFIKNLSALTDISISIDEKLNNLSQGKKYICFDSITTMLMHNKPYVFARFVHNILTKMRIKGVGGVLISIQDNSNRDIRSEIAQLCDKVIRI